MIDDLIIENRNQSKEFILEYEQLRKTITCSICLEIFTKPANLPCGHIYCHECLQMALKVRSSCPICSTKIVNKRQIHIVENIEHTLSLFEKLVKSLEPKGPILSLFHNFESKPLNDSNILQQTNNNPFKPTSSSSSSSNAIIPVLTTTDNENITLNTSNDSIEQPLVFSSGELVNVLPRTWTGINKLGGVGWVQDSQVMDEMRYYSVKYVLDGNYEHKIPALFVEKFQELDRESRRKKRTLEPKDMNISSSTPISGEKKKTKLKKSFESISSTPLNSLLTNIEDKENISHTSSTTSNKQSKKPSRSTESIVILTTSLDLHQKSIIEKKMEKLSEQFPNITLATHFSPDVTHLVVSVDKQGVLKQRTMKYMQSVAKGNWIISSNWVIDCLKLNTICNEEDYEIKENSKAKEFNAPRRSRLINHPPYSSSISISSQKLFTNIIFLFYGHFPLPGPAKSELESLIYLCNGQILPNKQSFLDQYKTTGQISTKDKYIVIFSGDNFTNKEELNCFYLQNIQVLSSLWILDSITNYCLQPYENYLIPA